MMSSSFRNSNVTAAISRIPCRFASKPLVSMSTATGRNPRKRCDIRFSAMHSHKQVGVYNSSAEQTLLSPPPDVGAESRPQGFHLKDAAPGWPRDADAKATTFVPGMRVGVPDSPAGTFKARAYAHQHGNASPPGVPAGECGTPTRRPVMTGNATFVPESFHPDGPGDDPRANAKGLTFVPGLRVGVPDSPAGTFKARACAHQHGNASPAWRAGR